MTESTEKNHELWRVTLARLKEKLSRMEFYTWFPKTILSNREGGAVLVQCPTEMHRNWISQKYQTIVLSNLQSVDESVEHVYFEVNGALADKDTAYPEIFQKKNDKPKQVAGTPTIILPEGVESRVVQGRYSLQNFIVSDESQLAHSACMAVAEGIYGEKKYNPLFIYGGVGLGKTHLLQGTANEITRRHNDAVVVYTTAERFFNELIKAIRTKRNDLFRKKYRRADILIIDDVQFFNGKEYAQDELFNTFNDLFELQKQIIFAADRPPSELTGISDRLRSRMGWGLSVDVALPAFEPRIAIVQQKAQNMSLLLPTDIEQMIAANVRSTLREVENILTQIRAEVEITKQPPTEYSVGRILRKIHPSQQIATPDEAKRGIVRSPDEIITFVSEYLNVPATEILGTSRKREQVHARQICWLLCKDVLQMSYEAIAENFQKNHTTIMYGVKKLRKSLQTDGQMARMIHAIRLDLGIREH